MTLRPITIAAFVLASIACPPSARCQSPVAPLVKMPVRGGVITLKVTDYEAARRRLTETAAQYGAEVKDAITDVNEKGAKHGWTRLILPQDQLAGLLAAVKSSGTLYAEKVETKDATSESESLEHRAGLLREHQEHLQSLMSASRRLRSGDILFVQDRLFRAAVDEGELRQAKVDLARSAQTSTLMVVMFEPGASPAAQGKLVGLGHWFSVGIGRAHAALNHDLARAVTATAYVAVFAWLWAPIALAAIIVERRTRATARLAQAIRTAVRAASTRHAAPPPAEA